MDDAEKISKSTYENVMKYFEYMLKENEMNILLEHFNRYFPTWSDLWFTIKKWLKESSKTSLQNTIHSFAQLFPNYESFKAQLDNALAIDPIFWHAVYNNLQLAKEKL